MLSLSPSSTKRHKNFENFHSVIRCTWHGGISVGIFIVSFLMYSPVFENRSRQSKSLRSTIPKKSEAGASSKTPRWALLAPKLLTKTNKPINRTTGYRNMALECPQTHSIATTVSCFMDRPTFKSRTWNSVSGYKENDHRQAHKASNVKLMGSCQDKPYNLIHAGLILVVIVEFFLVHGLVIDCHLFEGLQQALCFDLSQTVKNRD